MNRLHVLLATALGTTLTAMLPVAAYAQHDWSGPYVGASVAGIVTMDDVEFDYSNMTDDEFDFEFDEDNILVENNFFFGLSGGPFPDMFSLDDSSFGVSLNAGYNFQTGNIVYGVESDVTVFGGSGSANFEGPASRPDFQLLRLSEDALEDLIPSEEGSFASASGGLDALLTLRARVGVTVDKLLFYGTAGLAAGQATYSNDLAISDDGKFGSFAGAVAGAQTSETVFGLVAGAGVEYALTDTASIKLEGLYYHLGDVTTTSNGSGFSEGGLNEGTVQPFTSTFNPSGAIIRAGVNVGVLNPAFTSLKSGRDICLPSSRLAAWRALRA